ncbi:hypothetical protein ACFHW2_11500 [Actinomadura sp. LOL_016]|uniref:hypothetical protein n=1 Tax=unclassified Actinomadura TaxID=2626254 RepID=UPI003A810000
MKIRLMGLPEETTAAVEALRAGRFDVLEVSAPRPNRGDSQLVRVYVEVQLAEHKPVPAGPGPDEHLNARLRRAQNVLGWARNRARTLQAKHAATPDTQRARRKECQARLDEVQRLVDEFDKALTDEGTPSGE